MRRCWSGGILRKPSGLQPSRHKYENIPLLILDLRLDIVYSIGRLHLEGDGLACECFYEDLHSGNRWIADTADEMRRMRVDQRTGRSLILGAERSL